MILIWFAILVITLLTVVLQAQQFVEHSEKRANIISGFYLAVIIALMLTTNFFKTT